MVLSIEFTARATEISDMAATRLMISLLIFTDRVETDALLAVVTVLILVVASKILTGMK